MLGKRPRPFLRTTSKSQLALAFSGDVLGPPPHPAESRDKYSLPAPQHVVIGFDVGGSKNSKPIAQSAAGESPRSVLEPGALCDSSHQYHHQQSRSPRSVLGSLLSGPESHHLHKQGVGLGVVAAIRAEERAFANTESKSKPLAITGQNIEVGQAKVASRETHGSYRASDFVSVFRDVDHCDDVDEDEEDDLFLGVQESIFCPSSPFSNCPSLDVSAGDFLSVCYFCKRQLTPGKDIFMYRGDRAFCSVECRYQQITIDESKERSFVGCNCSPVVSLCDGRPCPVIPATFA